MKIIKIMAGLLPAIIILSAVLIPFLNTTAPPTINGWSYDDYKPATNVSSATGALELITVAGEDYLHAADVGPATITYDNGTTDDVTVSKANLDLVFMYGQSNAAYRNAVPTEATPIPMLGTAYYYGLEDRSGPNAAENNTGMDLDSCEFWPMLNADGACRIGDKAPAFSATYNQITGHKVYWVCGAIGNKVISQFQPTTGFMWTYGKSVLTDAISLVDTDKFNLNVSYYIWCQGEGNATTPVETYKTAFLNVHNAMLNGGMGVQFKGCFMSVVRDTNGINASIAQRELIEEYSTIHLGADIAKDFTISNGLMGSDDLHYSQLGNNLIGKTVGTNMGDYVAGPLGSTDNTVRSMIYVIPVVIAAGIVIFSIRAYVTRDE